MTFLLTTHWPDMPHPPKREWGIAVFLPMYLGVRELEMFGYQYPMHSFCTWGDTRKVLPGQGIKLQAHDFQVACVDLDVTLLDFKPNEKVGLSISLPPTAECRTGEGYLQHSHLQRGSRWSISILTASPNPLGVRKVAWLGSAWAPGKGFFSPLFSMGLGSALSSFLSSCLPGCIREVHCTGSLLLSRVSFLSLQWAHLVMLTSPPVTLSVFRWHRTVTNIFRGSLFLWLCTFLKNLTSFSLYLIWISSLCL